MAAMKTTFLDFEQPLAELDAKIEELRYVQDDSALDISEEIGRLQKKSQTLTRDIYGKLTAWQIAQVARAYRVYYQKVPGKDGAPYLMDHSSIVYLLDRNGRFVTHFTHEAKAETIAAAVQRLL